MIQDVYLKDRKILLDRRMVQTSLPSGSPPSALVCVEYYKLRTLKWKLKNEISGLCPSPKAAQAGFYEVFIKFFGIHRILTSLDESMVIRPGK